MANVKISDLPAASTPLTGAELVPVVQSGVTSQTTVGGLLGGPNGSNLAGYLPSGTGAVATTVQTKLRETVSVKDFGAIGDGVTDDTAAIQAALNNGSGRSIYFPEGHYIVSSPLSVKTRTNIIGEQRGVLGKPSGYVNYFGDYVSGTLIEYTGDNACFELIGANTTTDVVEQCIFENIALWAKPLTQTLVFANYKPSYAGSRAFICQNGSGHQWINCWFSSFGYAGIQLGIQGTYRGTTYSADYTGTGRPTNCKIVNCYSSNVFGYGIAAYTDYLEVIGWESDSFTINSSTYSGFQNPVSTNYETGAVFLANSGGCRFTDCHFEGDSARSSGVNILRNAVSVSSNYPLQNKFTACHFYGNIYGLQIGKDTTGSPIETQISNCAFAAAQNGTTAPIAGIWDAGLQTAITGCTFSGGSETQALYAGGTDSTVIGNVFKGCNLPITSAYRNIFVGNTSTSTVGTYSVVASTSTEPPRMSRNSWDKTVNLNSAPIRATDGILDYQLGLSSQSSSAGGGVLNIKHTSMTTLSTTGTLVGTLYVSAVANYHPFMIRIRTSTIAATKPYAEVLVYGSSVNGGSPVITTQTLLAANAYAAVGNVVSFAMPVAGQINISLLSGSGASNFATFEIDIVAFNGKYLPAV